MGGIEGNHVLCLHHGVLESLFIRMNRHDDFCDSQQKNLDLRDMSGDIEEEYSFSGLA